MIGPELIELGRQSSGHRLVEQGRPEVVHGLELGQSAHQRAWAAQPAHPEPAPGRLAEGPGGEDDGVGAGERGDRRRAVVVQRAVLEGVVLDDRHPRLRGQLGQLAPPAHGEQRSRRVVERGHEVQGRGPGGGHCGTDAAYVDAVVVHRHRRQAGTAVAEHVERAGEAGRLHHHGVTRPDQQLRRQVHRLLGAGGHQDLVGLGRGAVAGQHRGEGVPQFGQTGRQRSRSA